jgi:hypothetical protein
MLIGASPVLGCSTAVMKKVHAPVVGPALA